MKNFWRVPFISIWIILEIILFLLLGIKIAFLGYFITGFLVALIVEPRMVKRIISLTFFWLPCLLSRKLLEIIDN